MRKIASLTLFTAMALTLFGGCSGGSPSAFDPAHAISVISREDGSGTRGAFIALFGVEARGEDGSKKDLTTKEAIIENSTSIVMTNVAAEQYAIGYISLGSLNDTVKAVQIQAVAPTAQAVQTGAYPIARPFLIATKGTPTGLTADFIDFILSAEGQAIVAGSYVAVAEDAPPYAGSRPAGKLVVAGSSSVSPIMEKLKEAYLAINPNGAIELQESDSSAGLNAAIEGTCDIAMTSRDLTQDEQSQLLPVQIAIDGIAVIVNTNNPVTTLSVQQVCSIYTGELTAWSEVIQ